MTSNLLLTANDVIYKDFLLKLEDEPTPELVQKLQNKIEELENKMLEQNKASQQRELEQHQVLDQKKCRWIMRYLEAKMQLENNKDFYQDGKKMWHHDTSNMFKAVKTLFKKIKEKDTQCLDMLKDLEKELQSALSVSINLSSSHNSNPHLEHHRTPPHDLEIIEEAFIQDVRFTDPKVSSGRGHHRRGGFFQDLKTPMEKEEDSFNPSSVGSNEKQDIYKTLKLDETSIISAYSSSEFMSKQENIKNDFNNYYTPRSATNLAKKQFNFERFHHIANTDQIISTNRSTSAANTSSSSLFSILTSLQKKIKGYILEVNETIAKEQMTFDSEISSTLKRVQNLFKDESTFNTASFNAHINHMNPTEPNRMSFQNFPAVDPGKQSIVDKGSMLAILDNNISPKNSFKSKLESSKKDDRSSNMSRMLTKVLKVDDTKKNPNNNMVRLLEDLQASLSLSEREAVLYTLANQKESNKTTNDIKLDDLLAVSTNLGKNASSISHLFLPNSVKKRMSPKSLYTDLKIEEEDVIIDEANPKLNETLKASTLRSQGESRIESLESSKTFNLKEELKITSDFKPPVTSNNKIMKNGTIMFSTNNHQQAGSFFTGNQQPGGSFLKTHQKVLPPMQGFSDLRNKILKDNISPILPKCEGQKINKKIDFDEESIIEESKRVTGKLAFSEKSLEEDNMPSSERNLQKDNKMLHSTEVTKLDKIEETSPRKVTNTTKKTSGKNILNEKENKTKKSKFCFNICGSKKL